MVYNPYIHLDDGPYGNFGLPAPSMANPVYKIPEMPIIYTDDPPPPVYNPRAPAPAPTFRFPDLGLPAPSATPTVTSGTGTAVSDKLSNILDTIKLGLAAFAKNPVTGPAYYDAAGNLVAGSPASQVATGLSGAIGKTLTAVGSVFGVSAQTIVIIGAAGVGLYLMQPKRGRR